jgi:uncharacterized protein YjiS (DUF1127 family)
MPRCMLNVLTAALDWMAERQQRQMIRELRRLDDRTLIDIGLDPAEIATIACSDRRLRGRRRALIAKSSRGIMAAELRILAATPVRRSALALLAALSVVLSLSVVAAVAAETDAKPIRLHAPDTAEVARPTHGP